MIENGRIRNTNLPYSLLRPWQMRQYNKCNSAEDAEDDCYQGAERIDERCNTRQNGCFEHCRCHAWQVNIRQNVLVDEFRLNSVFLVTASEGYATKHTISIEPMCVSTQCLICHRISSIADVFTTSKLFGDGPTVCAWSQTLDTVDGREVAREVSIRGECQRQS